MLLRNTIVAPNRCHAMTMLIPSSRTSVPRRKRLTIAASTAAALAATAAFVAAAARRAEREHPPRGAFVYHDGVRLHYLERGRGTPVVLLHGNLVHAGDFVASGLVDRLAERHRVIAFDRPGFGYSERPRDRLWTADAQARLLHGALRKLGAEHPIVLGHSWGAMVALALAQRAPSDVRKLVLLSGYYFPTVRLDVAIAAPPALPIVGDVMRYTLSALTARLALRRTVQAMFAPQPVPGDFLPTLGRGLLVRPSQIRATAEDAAFMVPGAAALRKRYATMQTPTVIFAGDADAVVAPDQARRLHRELRGSVLHVLPGLGHMLHHAAVAEVAAAIVADERRLAAVTGAHGGAARDLGISVDSIGASESTTSSSAARG
jgi:pimeloyl-ACP methyl ester carboxylesterase